jgi:hypothetical protein
VAIFRLAIEKLGIFDTEKSFKIKLHWHFVFSPKIKINCRPKKFLGRMQKSLYQSQGPKKDPGRKTSQNFCRWTCARSYQRYPISGIHDIHFKIADLQDFFSQYGTIENCNVMIQPESSKSRGFGFIVFREKKTIKKCLADSDNHILNGKWVNFIF